MKKPPLVSGLPIFGNGLNMLKDPLAYLLDSYHEYGSIFRLRVLGREVVVLAGLEANRLLISMGAKLAKGGIYAGFNDELGQDTHFSVVDGEVHFRLRRAVRSAYTKQQNLCHLPHIIDLIRVHTSEWQNNEKIAVVRTMEQIIGELLGTMLTRHPAGEYLHDFAYVIKALHYVYPMQVWPKFMLNLPKYQTAKKRLFAFSESILAYHQNNPPLERPQNLIDDLILAYQRDDNPLTREQVIGQIFTPYFVGIDTVAATISFLTYLLLKHEQILEKIIAEVDTAFSNADFNPDDLPTLAAAINETARLYPIAPFLVRRAMQPFIFAGYEIPEGTDLIIATAVLHYLDEFYPDPHQFDVSRDNVGLPGSFASWGLGPHACLGSGLAQILMQVMMATILREWKLCLYPKEFELNMTLSPLPNPGESFRIMVQRR